MGRRKIDLSTSGQGNIIDMKTGNPIEKPVMPVICERIKFYRERIGMEQKELAKRIGITANSISNWENGRSRPDINLLPAICRELDISFYELYDIPDPTIKFTVNQIMLVDRYSVLSKGHQHAVDRLIDALTEVELAEGCPDLVRLQRFDRPLAAGIGDPSELFDDGEYCYVYSTPEVLRADGIFRINGDSMEPDFKSGEEVLVEMIPGGRDLDYGEIGAFVVGNETYIKRFEEDGLYSSNKKYKPIRFCEEERVYLIGRVLSAFAPQGYAKQSDIEKYQAVYGDE